MNLFLKYGANPNYVPPYNNESITKALVDNIAEINDAFERFEILFDENSSDEVMNAILYGTRD